MTLSVPEQYPLVPPAVRFKTKVFHPNVHFKVGLQAHTEHCSLGCRSTHTGRSTCKRRVAGLVRVSSAQAVVCSYAYEE